MKDRYFVLSGDNNTVYFGREVDDGPQSFKTFEAAEKRAKKYAETEPGIEIKIVKVEAVVIAEVSKPTMRKCS